VLILRLAVEEQDTDRYAESGNGERHAESVPPL